jgi:hypothetical protein
MSSISYDTASVSSDDVEDSKEEESMANEKSKFVPQAPSQFGRFPTFQGFDGMLLHNQLQVSKSFFSISDILDFSDLEEDSDSEQTQ